MNNLNAKLKKLRINSGLTQAELGTKLNINPKVISKWENGESLPSADILPAIADVYEIGIDELFGRISEKSVDIKAIVRKYGYDHAYNIPDIQNLFSYIVLGMQERDNVDCGCYSAQSLKEISDELASLIENNDDRPQCHLINREYGIVNYVCDGFRIGSMTCCEADVFDELVETNYSVLRRLFEALSLDGADRLVRFFLNTNENVSFTLEYLIKKTATEERVAKSFLDVLFSMTKISREAVIQKESAVLDGKETEIYTFYPGNETNILKTVVLSAILLLKERGGYR